MLPRLTFMSWENTQEPNDVAFREVMYPAGSGLWDATTKGTPALADVVARHGPAGTGWLRDMHRLSYAFVKSGDPFDVSKYAAADAALPVIQASHLEFVTRGFQIRATSVAAAIGVRFKAAALM